MCHYLTLISKSERSAGFSLRAALLTPSQLHTKLLPATKRQWKSCFLTEALIWPLNMQRGNMAGREWIQIEAFLSIYWEDKEDLEQNIHLVIKIPGELARWGGSSSWGLLLLTFSVVSPMDLSFKLADVEVWCYFLFLICCLKTSHISVSLWPTLDVLMFKE